MREKLKPKQPMEDGGCWMKQPKAPRADAPSFHSVKKTGASEFEQKATKGTKDVPSTHSPLSRLAMASVG